MFKKSKLVFALSLAGFALSGCMDDEHYDKNSNYVAFDADGRPAEPAAVKPQTQTRRVITETYTTNGDVNTGSTGTTTITTQGYVRAGIYDANGLYITPGYGPDIPAAMMPGVGLCRVWFTDRPARDEPPVQSCDGLRNRVPSDAYVIYGG